MCFLAQT